MRFLRRSEENDPVAGKQARVCHRQACCIQPDERAPCRLPKRVPAQSPTSSPASRASSLKYRVVNTLRSRGPSLYKERISERRKRRCGQYSTQSGTIAFLSGSPATDPTGSDGPVVTFDNADSLLIQGESLSGTLGIYSVSAGTLGKPGSIRFQAEAQLAFGDEKPTDFAQLGSTLSLFVDPRADGVVEACHLSPSGVSGCTSVAVLTSTNGFAEGIAIL